jgi:hypothetical protein
MDVDFTNTDSSVNSGSNAPGLDYSNPAFANPNPNNAAPEWDFGNPSFFG